LSGPRTILEADRIFGLNLEAEDASADELYRAKFGERVPAEDLPEDIQLLLNEREEARSSRNWPRADEIRDALQERGYTIEDSAQGPQVFRH
jgi:cysteinyl-tRNA synthetase